MVTFKNTEFKFPTPLEIGSTNIAYWEFDGDPDKIDKITTSCGCTANCRVEGNKVVAEYTDQDGPKVTHDTAKKLYSKGEYSFNKSIFIYLKDGYDTLIKNERGVLITNPSKPKITLTFNGKIDVSSLLTK